MFLISKYFLLKEVSKLKYTLPKPSERFPTNQDVEHSPYIIHNLVNTVVIS